MEVKVTPSNPAYIDNMLDEAEMGLINVSKDCITTSNTDFIVVLYDSGCILIHLMSYMRTIIMRFVMLERWL